MRDPTHRPGEAYASIICKNEWKRSDPAVGADLAFLEQRLKGDIGITSATLANDKWTVSVDPVTAPSSVWLYDRSTPRPDQAVHAAPGAREHAAGGDVSDRDQVARRPDAGLPT